MMDMMDKLNKEYTRRFRGPKYDMIPDDLQEDTWALVPAGTSHRIIIGTRDQILHLYDNYNNGNEVIDIAGIGIIFDDVVKLI